MTKRSALLLFVAVAVVSTLPFLQTTGFGFVNLDDYEYRYIPQIESGLSLRTLVWGFTFLAHGIWMPLTWCSYALDISLFGGTPGGMHLHNVILHGLCGGLLFLVLSSLLPSKGWKNYLPSLLIALFWSLHPLRVEPVAWVASRKDVLSFFFELIALLLWVRHIKFDAGRNWFTNKTYWRSFLFFVLATMAKPSAMTFPVIAILLDIFVIRPEKEEEKWNWKKYIPLFAYAFCIAVLAQRAQAIGGGVGATGSSLLWRILNAISSYGVYLFHTVYPINLAAQCVCRNPAMPKHLVIGIVCVVGVGAFILIRILHLWNSIKDFKRSEGWILAGFLMFTLTVGPFLGIASFGYHAYADRFTYVPSLGLCILLLGLLRKCSPRVLSVVCGCFVVVISLLACRTWYQTGFWKNDEVLYRHTIEVDDDKSAQARRSLAVYYYEIDHNPEKVIEEYERAREINENESMDVAHTYLVSLFETGQAEKGADELYRYQRKLFDNLEQVRKARNWEKQNVSATFLVACSAQAIVQGEYETVIENQNKLFSQVADYNFCRYLEGIMYLKQGDSEKALAAFRRVGPNYIDSFIRFRWLTEKLPPDDTEALKMISTFAWKEPDTPVKK